MASMMIIVRIIRLLRIIRSAIDRRSVFLERKIVHRFWQQRNFKSVRHRQLFRVMEIWKQLRYVDRLGQARDRSILRQKLECPTTMRYRYFQASVNVIRLRRYFRRQPRIFNQNRRSKRKRGRMERGKLSWESSYY